MSVASSKRSRSPRKGRLDGAALSSGPLWVPRAFAALLLALGIVPLSNLLTDQTPDPWFNGAAVQWAVLTVIVVGIALLAASILGERLDRWHARLSEAILAPSGTAFALTCAVISCSLAAASAWFVFGGRWVSPDEAFMAWHGRILLSGHLWVPIDTDPAFFGDLFMPSTRERWYSQFPIGGPLFMALGYRVRAHWLVAPVLTGITVYAFYRFASRAFDEGTARTATVILTACGSLFLMGGTHMTHVPALALITIALAAVAEWATTDDRRAAYRSAAVIGAAVAATLAFRPYDAAVAALVIGVLQLTALRGAHWRARTLVAQLAGGLLPLALILAANRAMTGHAMQFGYEAMNGSAHDPGFHLAPSGFEHTPLRGLMLASSYLMSLNETVLYSPIPALLLIAVGLLAMRRTTRWNALAMAMILAFVVAYGAYWFEGWLYGPRFLYPVIPLFVLLAATAPGHIAARLTGNARRATVLILPLCLGYAWLLPGARFGLVDRMIKIRASTVRRSFDPMEAVRRADIHHALVLVPVDWTSRLISRMLAMHVDAPTALQIRDFADACALQRVLDREEGDTAPTSVRIARIVAATRGDQPAPLTKLNEFGAQVRLRDPGALPADCAIEMQRDSARFFSYADFISLNDLDASGRVTGDVIYARDYGPERDEHLRARFRDRTWYVIERSDSAPGRVVLVPYRRPGAPTGTP